MKYRPPRFSWESAENVAAGTKRVWATAGEIIQTTVEAAKRMGPGSDTKRIMLPSGREIFLTVQMELIDARHSDKERVTWWVRLVSQGIPIESYHCFDELLVLAAAAKICQTEKLRHAD